MKVKDLLNIILLITSLGLIFYLGIMNYKKILMAFGMAIGLTIFILIIIYVVINWKDWMNKKIF